MAKTKIEQRLEEIEKEKSTLVAALKKQKALKQFKCGCGKMHRIKDCKVIQTHWYTSSSGCSRGDYWNEGELRIICPDTYVRNRLLFDTYDVEWEKRSHYDYNAGKQFSRIYKELFKEVIEDYSTDKSNWVNNYYIDINHEKFGLCVKGRDYKAYKKEREIIT